jgi:hypothetical protein
VVRFEGVTTAASGPVLSYATYSRQGDLTLSTAFVQSPIDADRVKLTLSFDRGDPGIFRVSTFNAVGESLLSSESASL